MEITYRRNLHRSYMCIEEPEKAIEEHEMMILKNYDVPRILPLQIMIQDGKVQYWFEITGKQQLKDYLGGKSIGMEFLKKMLFSLEELCRKLPEYMLREERIFLREEFLYVDLVDETIYFTYLPFWCGDFPEEFQRWMEEILKGIDHQDRKCTQTAYDLYEKVRQGNRSIRELLNTQKWSEEPLILQKKIEGKASEPKYVNAVEAEEKENIAGKIPWDKIKTVCLEVKENIEEKCMKFVKKKEKEKPTLRTASPDIEEMYPQKEEPIGNPTELLVCDEERMDGRLVYQGRNGCRDFRIEKEEFLIGRSAQQADGRIETDGISRVHAKISRREGNYYIEDLNSTNGTYLNGELLEYHKDRKLEKDDKVRFGVEEYVFY